MIRLVSLILCAAVAAGAELQGQSRIQVWGSRLFDTEVAHASDYVEVVAGRSMTLARTAAGEIRGWGNNINGESECLPFQVGGPFVSMAVFDTFGLALRANGTFARMSNLAGWPALPPGIAYTAVAVGRQHQAALRSDGVLVMVGDNAWGQTAVPTLPAGVRWAGIAAGDNHMLGLRTDGVLMAWGDNRSGQCNVPSLVPGLSFQRVGAGFSNSFAWVSDGSLLVWGANNYGQATLPPFPAGSSWASLSLSALHGAGVRADGSIVCWGANSYGQCNVPALPAGLRYVGVAAGWYHTAGLRSDGRVICWGDDSYYEVGFPPLPPGETYADVAVTGQAAVAIKNSGSGIVIGSQGGYYAIPVVPPGVSILECGAGGSFFVALLSDGTVLCWGDNTYGQLNAPPLPVGLRYVAVTCGTFHTLALRSDGAVVAWGDNGGGQCNVPTSLGAVKQLAAGWVHSLVLLSDGSVVGWGSSPFGQLVVPPLPPGLRYEEIAAGSHRSLARRSDGEIIAFGCPGSLLCGLSLPVPAFPDGVYCVQLAIGHGHAVARGSDGSLRTWGAGLGARPAPESTAGNVDIDAFNDLSIARLGPAATYVRAGQGCPGGATGTEVSSLVPLTTPRAGREMRLTITNVPGGAFLATGLEGVGSPLGALPLSLAQFGMPGCFLHVSPVLVAFLGGNSGFADCAFPVPGDPRLIGSSFLQQALLLDPSANAAGVVVSHGSRGVIQID